MKKTYNDVPNLHAIVLRYLGTTEHRGARLLLYSPRFEQRIIVSRDYATSNIVCVFAYSYDRIGYVTRYDIKIWSQKS